MLQLCNLLQPFLYVPPSHTIIVDRYDQRVTSLKLIGDDTLSYFSYPLSVRNNRYENRSFIVDWSQLFTISHFQTTPTRFIPVAKTFARRFVCVVRNFPRIEIPSPPFFTSFFSYSFLPSSFAHMYTPYHIYIDVVTGLHQYLLPRYSVIHTTKTFSNVL